MPEENANIQDACVMTYNILVTLPKSLKQLKG